MLIFFINFLLLAFMVSILYFFILVFQTQLFSSDSFECGFKGYGSAHVTFSLRFFLILVLFLILDVELTFFLHLPIIINYGFSDIRFFLYLGFLMSIIGILEEFRRGMLNWK